MNIIHPGVESSRAGAWTSGPADARFDRRRRTIGLFAGAAGGLVVWLLPLGVDAPEHRLAAVVTLVVLWWITEALPFAATTLLGIALAVVTGVAPAEEAFAPFASPNVFLFIGCFIIARAASHHQLDRRIAAAIVSRQWAQRSLSGVRTAMVLLTMAVSAWMSNGTTVALMLPIATGLLPGLLTACGAAARPYTIGLLLSIAYAAGIGGMMTPIGSPPNLITIGLLQRAAGIHLDFFTWMSLMVPIAVAHVALLLVLSRWRFPSPYAADGTVLLAVGIGPDMVGPWTRGQRNCAFVCVVVATLWLAPGLVALVAEPESPFALLVGERLNEGTSAVLAAGLLFVRKRSTNAVWQRR